MSYALQLRLRESSGLVITIAVHAAIGTAILLGLGIVTIPKAPPPPIITKAIPDAVKAPRPADPVIRDQAIPIDTAEPVVTIDTVVQAEWTRPVNPEPTAVSGSDVGATVTAIIAPLPVGPTSIARLDQRYARDFQPPYPSASQRLGEEGVVTVHVIIDSNGHVVAATVAKSSGHARLDAAAVAQALAKWRFIPALDNGLESQSARDISVVFRITAG